MAKADFVGLNTEQLLNKALGGWTYMGFDFPKAKGDGITGTKCISKASKQFLRRRAANGSWQAFADDVTGLLSAHLYFTASCGEIKDNSSSLTVHLTKFHLTVRRTKCQALIDGNGPSVITSTESIHINRNTDWVDRADNLDELVNKLAGDTPNAAPFTKAEVLDFLNNRLGWTTARMAVMAADLCEDVRAHIAPQVGVTVTVTADKSVTGR